jgi:cryptochrome
LFWREYFYQLSYKNEKFAQVDGNPMTFKIPWDYFGKQDLFLKWEQAKTGFPWIDACMRQLKQEGWVHHVCRNSLALFQTRGTLFLSWERGLKTFFHHLIDVCGKEAGKGLH